MKALLIALLVLTACGKAVQSPVSPAVSASKDAAPQVVTVADDTDPAPAAPVEATYKVTFKFQYITGTMATRHAWTYTYGECDQVRFMTAPELDQLGADYGSTSGLGSACNFSSSFSGSSYTLDCQDTDARNLPYVDVSLCEWAVPYGAMQ